MNKSEHCKEVYAYFGLAMYRAQCVEQSIVQLLIFFDFFIKNVPKFRTSQQWEMDFDTFDKALSKKTMGNLLSLLKDIGVLDETITNKLSLALKKRNYLAHTYFVEHALDFINEAGRNNMIKELQEIIEMLNTVEETLQPISRAAAIKYGLTDEVLERLKNEMYESVNGDLNEVD